MWIHVVKRHHLEHARVENADLTFFMLEVDVFDDTTIAFGLLLAFIDLHKAFLIHFWQYVEL